MILSGTLPQSQDGLVWQFHRVVSGYLSNFLNQEQKTSSPFLPKTYPEKAAVSTGQRVRVGLALNLLSDADCYMFDEVTGNLDAPTAKEITMFLKRYIYNKPEVTFIFGTHDESLIEELRNAGARRIYDYTAKKCGSAIEPLIHLLTH